MRRSALFLLALAACSEPTLARLTPTDRFAYPAAVAVTARQGGGTALLVASGNYDLNYDGPDGGTVLSVDPSLAVPDGLGGYTGGSAGQPGGALVKLGAGAHVGSFASQMVVVDATTCPGTGTTARPPEALLTTRFADQVWHLPLDLDGHLGECQGGGCVFDIEKHIHDPFGVVLACRADQLRRSAFVAYLRTSDVNNAGLVGWLAEVDLDHPAAPARTIPLGNAGFSGLAYDDRTDRLFVLGEPALAAPIWVIDLTPCQIGAATCPTPDLTFTDLTAQQPGLDLQSIALSRRLPDPADPGRELLPRRAYVSARVYDPSLAALLGGRPSADVGAVLLVLDLEEDPTGRISFKVLRRVPIGMGPSRVQLLPQPATAPGAVPRRDVVVVSSATEGVVTVYDDEVGQVVRVIPLDAFTGAPEAGRSPFGLAAELLPGAPAVARVYAAAVQQAAVGIIDVPLDAPGLAHTLRNDAGLVRIGGIQ